MSETTRLADVLDRQREEEREQALRTLLTRPLLAAGDPALALVRRHAEYLREWFARETGWWLTVERGCARLYKRPVALDDATRGQPGFDRDRYVLLCLACAVLERSARGDGDNRIAIVDPNATQVDQFTTTSSVTVMPKFDGLKK